MPDAKTDPATVVRLVKMSSFGSKRRVEVQRTNLRTRQNENTSENSWLSIRYEPSETEEDLVRITPLEPLAPGEYALGFMNPEEIYLFGVER
jgi:hypothetical protein